MNASLPSFFRGNLDFGKKCTNETHLEMLHKKKKKAIGLEHRSEDTSSQDTMRWQTKPVENRSLYVPTRRVLVALFVWSGA